MQAHWSREDLPNWEAIRDLDEASGNGLRTRMVVIDIALDAVVEHLNAHFPKVAADADYVATVWERMYRVASKERSAAADSAQMWMDEAVEQRDRAERAESLAEVAKATAHTHLETLVSMAAKRNAAPVARLRAFATECVEHGDMTPAAARMLNRILDGE